MIIQNEKPWTTFSVYPGPYENFLTTLAKGATHTREEPPRTRETS